MTAGKRCNRTCSHTKYLVCLQWLDHHKRLGVGRVYVVDHLSQVSLMHVRLLMLTTTRLATDAELFYRA